MSTRNEVLEDLIKRMEAGERNVKPVPLPGRPGIEAGLRAGKLFLTRTSEQDKLEQASRGGAADDAASMS